MLNKKIKALLLCLIASPLLLVSQSTLAACSWADTGKQITVKVTFGTVIVQRDAPVGSIIASVQSGAFNGEATLFICSDAWVLVNEPTLFTTISSYGNKVYDTNIPGVGIRISGASSAIPYNLNYVGSSAVFISNRTVELVKTSAGSVGAGSLNTGDIAKAYAQAEPTYRTLLALTGSNSIIPVACSVKNTVINVNLDDAVYSDFSGVGSTAKSKDFNIGLNCDAGTKVKLTLDGNAAGPAGVLKLNAGANQAKGMGIQLVKGHGDPISQRHHARRIRYAAGFWYCDFSRGYATAIDWPILPNRSIYCGWSDQYHGNIYHDL